MTIQNQSYFLRGRNNIRLYIIISFIIFVVSLAILIIHNFCPLISTNILCVGIFEDVVHFIFVNSVVWLAILSILFFLPNSTFTKWSEVFFEPDDDEKNKTNWIIGSVYLFVLLYGILNIGFSHWALEISKKLFKLSIWGIFGVWISTLSFIVAVKIYFEVQKTKTKTLEDYLNTAIRAIEKMETHEKLVIIAPTLYVGSIVNEHKVLSRQFRQTLIEKANRISQANARASKVPQASLGESPREEQGGITIAILSLGNYEFKKLEQNVDAEKHFKSYGSHPYFLYHSRSSDSAHNRNILDHDWYKNHCNFLYEINALDSIRIIHLNVDPELLYESVDKVEKEGFFCIANYHSGFLYMGEFNAASFNDAFFRGSWFEDKTVMKFQQKFIDELIEKNDNTQGTSTPRSPDDPNILSPQTSQ